MKLVTVRLAFEDDADVKQTLGSALKHLPGLRGAAILGGDRTTMLVFTSSVEEGKEIAELLAAGEEGTLDIVVE